MARIGVTVCIITLAVHSVDAVHYDAYRAANTLIGVVAGLAVTFFIWPVRGRAELTRTMRDVIKAARQLFDAVGRSEPLLRPLQGKLHDKIAALVKAGRDAEREWRTGRPADVPEALVLEVIRLGLDVLSAALAPGSSEARHALGLRIERLSSQLPN